MESLLELVGMSEKEFFFTAFAALLLSRFLSYSSQRLSKHKYLPWGFPKGGIPVKDLCTENPRPPAQRVEGGYQEIVNALSQCAVGQVANLLYLYCGLACTCVLLHLLTY